MAEHQSLVPNGMGYVAAQNNDALLAATAAIAAIGKKDYTPTDNGISSLVAMSLLSKDKDCDKGRRDHHLIEQTLGEIRKDIGDAKCESIKTECNIQAAIQVQDASNQTNFRHLDNRICETEKSAIVYAKDALIESLRVEARTADRLTAFERNVDNEFCEVKRDIQGVNTNLEKVNTHLTHLIDTSTSKLEFQAERNKGDLALQMERGFCKVREDHLEDEIASLRRANDSNIMVSAFSNQMNAINSVLIDLQQTARATNQTIQFGAGNVATPVATNNQVR